MNVATVLTPDTNGSGIAGIVHTAAPRVVTIISVRPMMALSAREEAKGFNWQGWRLAARSRQFELAALVLLGYLHLQLHLCDRPSKQVIRVERSADTRGRNSGT